MNKNEFDKHIVDKFDEHEFSFKQGNWDKLASQLDAFEDSSKGRIIWLRAAAIAASLLLMVSVFAWLNSGTKYGNEVAQTVPAVKNETTTPYPSTNDQEEIVSTEPVATEEKEQRKNSQHSKTLLASNSKSVKQTTAPVKEQNILQTENNSTEVAVADKKTKGPQAVTVANEVPSREVASANKNSNFSFSDKDVIEPSQRTGKKLSLSFTGGFNYGTLNEGYTAGVNARKKVGNKFFVESDLALVSNKASQANLSPDQLNTLNTTGHLREKPAEVKSPSNYLYVQFNPTVGYQLANKLSVGLGSDFQRVLGSEGDEERLVYQNDETKLLPGLDVGLTGRTEYAVTKSLKAGILYREGINNFLNGGDTYFDRRYVQVQLKFTILGK